MRNLRGSVVVEAALLLPVVLALIFRVFEVGRAVLGWSVLTHAVHEAARQAAVDPDLVLDDPGVLAQLDAQIAQGGFAVSTSGVQFTQPLQPGRLVRVSATINVTPITAMVFPGGVIPLRTSTVIRYER